jgi:predicted RNA-binding protein
VTNKENWQVVKEKKIWGVSEGNKYQLERVKIGDFLIFYVKPKRIGGVFVAVSNIFRSDERIFSSSGFPSDETFPNRIRLKPWLIPKKPIDFTPLIVKVSFIKRKDWKWGTSIFGRALKAIPESDFKLIEAELKKV